MSASPATLLELRFSGTYLFGNWTPPTDLFRVRVNPDTGGLPGSNWAAWSDDPALTVLAAIFADGFETGDVSAWSAAVP